MTLEQATKILKQAVASCNLAPLLAHVLEELARDAHGLALDAAPSFVASLTNRSLDECNAAVLDLVGRGLLLRIETDDGVRLAANYQALGLQEEVRAALVIRAQAFEMLGAPHSPKAMATLDAAFLTERDDLFLALEVTSHKVFRRLEERAEAGRRTVFLLPRRAHLPRERFTHHDEVRAAWIQFLRDGKPALRKNVRLLVTRRPLPNLYTSALSRHVVRLDLYNYGENTTRRGEMVQVKAGSSLYDLVHSDYRAAVASSPPLASLWPLEWAVFYLKRFWLTAGSLLLGAILTLQGAGIWVFLGTVAGGIGTNALSEQLKGIRWPLPEIFEK